MRSITRDRPACGGAIDPVRAWQESVARQRDQVLDYEIAVDDCRRAVDRCVDEFRRAVRERDRAARHLAHLIAWREDVDAVEATPRPLADGGDLTSRWPDLPAA